MKKAFFICFVLMMVAPLTVMAQKQAFSNGLYWELSGGVLTISGNGPMEDYSSPWKDKGAVVKVVIENGVTSIGTCCFWEYNKPHNLKSVVIGNSVKSIGRRAFQDCSSLTTVSIPNSVTSIGESAFQDCSSLTTVSIPNSVTSIGEAAFISIPNSVTSIGEAAFKYCSSLTTVSIPNSVTSIGEDAFYRCSSLTTVSIPNSVTSIGEWAFRGCSSLTTVSIPNSVTSIGKYAFDECSSLTTIQSLPISILEGGESEWNRIDLPKEAVYKYIAEHRNEERVRQIALANETKIRQYAKIADIKNKGGFSSAQEIKNGTVTYYIVTKNGRYGLVNATGQEIVGPELDVIEECGKGFLRFKVNGYWGVMNYTGKIIIPTDRGYTKIGDYVSFTKRFSYEMDGYRGECNNLGQQVSKIKVETAPQQQVIVKKEETPQKEEKKVEEKSTKQRIIIEHHRDPVPIQQWQACWACGGMGTMGCDNCGGSGTKYIGDRLHRCSRCNGQGLIPCNICHGNKGQYITVYQ